MAKDTILLLLRVLQVEIVLLLLFLLGFRTRVSRFWLIRISFGLLALVVLTLLVLLYVSYSNGVISAEPSHTKNEVPFWLISLMLAVVGYKRVQDIGRRRDEKIFAQSKSYKYLYRQTVIASTLFSIAPLAIYISILQPYLKSIFLIAFLFLASNITWEYFVISKKKVHEDECSRKDL